MEIKNVCDSPEAGFPENKIVLLNGNVLDCFPKSCPPEKIVSNKMKLDTTGVYLSFGKKRPVSKSVEDPDVESNRDFFLRHAFFFLNHAYIIMQDSRMFLAPVDINSGLAYVGNNGFKAPTLGVYLEWWLGADCNVMHDEKGREALTYYIAGSPLSGRNSCGCVYADGSTKQIVHYPFRSVWSSFVAVNSRYNEAKQIYESYTLQEVYEKLQNHEASELSTLKATLVMRNYRIVNLEKQVAELEERIAKKEQKIHDLYIQYNLAELTRLQDEYQLRKILHEQEMEPLRAERQEKKRMLQAGALSTWDYQQFLRSIRERNQAFEDYKMDLVNQIVKGGAMNFPSAKEWLENREPQEMA